MTTQEIQIGDHVTFGKYSVGVFRGLTEQGLARVEIGLDCISNPPQPMMAVVPLDELASEND